jgi:phosphoglycolate phosphatase
MKLIVFDLDGTLLNTLPDIHNSINYSLKHFDLKPNTFSQTKSYLGTGSLDLVKRSALKMYDVRFTLTSPLVEILHQFYNDYYMHHCLEKTYVYDHVLDTLKELKNDGYKIAVLSNKDNCQVEKIIEKYIPNTFDLVCGKTKDSTLKPNAHALNKILNYFNVTENETIIVGDSLVDIYFAKNLKTKIISVSYGFCDKELLKLAKPDYLIDDFKSILGVLHDNFR